MAGRFEASGWGGPQAQPIERIPQRPVRDSETLRRRVSGSRACRCSGHGPRKVPPSLWWIRSIHCRVIPLQKMRNNMPSACRERVPPRRGAVGSNFSQAARANRRRKVPHSNPNGRPELSKETLGNQRPSSEGKESGQGRPRDSGSGNGGR